MTQSHAQLPIRLLPRKGMQLGNFAIHAFILAMAIYWMGDGLGVQYMDRDDLFASLWARIGERPLVLIGLLVVALGVYGMARAVVRMLPGSPYYHLQVSSEGLAVRTLLGRHVFPWRSLNEFVTEQVERQTKHGTKIDHYTVGRANPGGAIRIFADEYGSQSGEIDAYALTAWLNALRARVLDNKLGASDQVEVPEAFLGSLIARDRPQDLRQVQRGQTVVRR